MSDYTLYSTDLLHYYKNPTHKGIAENISVKATQSNLSCGDSIAIGLELDDKSVKHACFDGNGCMVSVAASELLCENIEGKNLDEISKMSDSEFLSLLGFELTLSRQKCALTSFRALKKAINESH